jgi:hypothetical protein
MEMSAVGKTTIQVRAQELIEKSGRALLVRDAVVMALRELCPDRESAIELAATFMAGMGLALRRESYDLPEHNGQGTLFDVPTWIVVTSPEGDLAIEKDHATMGQVRQWRREGQQHHATQHLRFKRAGEELDLISDLDDELPWAEARAILGERRGALPESSE